MIPLPKLIVSDDTLSEIAIHLRASLPNEGCGLLATADEPNGDRRVVRFFPGDNIDRSPSRYTMDPAQVARAFTEMRERGWQLGAIVHSHPTGDATPSARDLREGFYPHAWMIVVALARPKPEIRVWRHSPGTAGDADELALGIVRA